VKNKKYKKSCFFTEISASGGLAENRLRDYFDV
jgi:hypothetical protein